MPRIARIGGPATSLPGTSVIASKNACLRALSSSVPGDGGKTISFVFLSRSSLPGKPGMKITGFGISSSSGAYYGLTALHADDCVFPDRDFRIADGRVFGLCRRLELCDVPRG